MNLRMVFNTTGRIIKVEALLLLLPLAASLIYNEKKTVLAFVITIAAALAVGALMSFFSRTKNHVIYAKEGFAIVALAWFGMSAIGALPFVLSGDIPSYIDAFFETVSGFTTTGASILDDVEAMSNGCLFWRSFTHWVGGMGVLVFVMALIPNIADRSIHIMRAEVPGPVVGKLVPRIKDTAKILYLIYIVLTIVEAVLLFAGGMTLFESILHSFGTAGTGGFGIKADSLAGYSPYQQWVITIFMLIFGVNFNLYYLILIRRAKTALKSTELWVYFGIVAMSVAMICVNVRGFYTTFAETLRHSAFQVASIITTTGYSSVDFNLWPDFSKAILLIIMFVGGCAGSTAGGLKVSRVVMLFKTIGREIRQMLHPRSVSAVRFEGKPLDDKTISGVCVYFALYMVCLLATFLLISVDGLGMDTDFSAAVSCFNNIGPAFGAAGPMSSYSGYSDFSTVILSFAMLFGRLEIFPILLALSPSTWSKK